MASFFGKINFLKFKNARIAYLDDNGCKRRGVFIPIEDNNVYVIRDRKTYVDKAAFFRFIAFECKKRYEWADTHCLKIYLNQEILQKLTPKEFNEIPAFGSMKPVTRIKEGVENVPIKNARKSTTR